MRIQPISELTPQPVDWLWPGRLALGKLAMLDGDPGLGKSLLALDLSARLSTGRPFPDDSPPPAVGNVIVLNAEDGERDTTRPRLLALGADLDRVFVLRTDDTDLGPPLRLPGQLSLLETALTRTAARLVVLDPVIAFLDASVCDRSDQAIRRALFPLAMLAARCACAVLMIRHLNKTTDGRALYRGSGSIGFLAACRSGWLVGRDPLQPEHRVLAQVKNNLAPPQPSLSFALHSSPAGLHLHWLGPSSWSADDLLAAASVRRTRPQRDRAVDFLAAFLADGPRTSRDVWDAALAQGLSRRTMFRARRQLEVRVVPVREGRRKSNYWLLPGQRVPSGHPPDAALADLEARLAALQEEFPPPTPLDD